MKTQRGFTISELLIALGYLTFLVLIIIVITHFVLKYW